MATSMAPMQSRGDQGRAPQTQTMGRQSDRQQTRPQNVGQAERWGSLLGGGALALYGLTRRSLGGLGLATLGAFLVKRGFTGQCEMYSAMGLNTAGTSGQPVRIPAGAGVKFEEATTINLPAEQVYLFWRNFENLPRFMYNLDSVQNTGGMRSHWSAVGPLGTRFEWDAEIIMDRPNEMISWQSLEGSSVHTAGSVHFKPAPGGHGTEVHVEMKYDPPGGKAGALLAELMGQAPEHLVREDLRRLKRLLETGEIPTTEGQSTGRRVGTAWRYTARGLGWFGIGLGLAELVAPEALGELIGLPRGHRTLLPLFGLREIASGIGILSQRLPTGWLWSRVGGDAMDLTFLASALLSHEADATGILGAIAAVGGVTAIDFLSSQQHTLIPDVPAWKHHNGSADGWQWSSRTRTQTQQ